MQLPTIHLNGDRPETLLTQYRNAYEKLGDALKALQEVETNGRNFYPQGNDAVTTAREEHNARYLAVHAVQKDMLELAQHCVQFVK